MFQGEARYVRLDFHIPIARRSLSQRCYVRNHKMSKTLTDNGFPPLSSFRLIVPPLQLVSAALLEIVKQGAVMYFGLLAEFITSVLETAPELLTDTERVQLVIGLRAKAVLQLCYNDTFANQQAFQLHLSYITNQDKETFNPEVKASVTNFIRLVHTLVEDQCQKDDFYQNIFPTLFGPKYDSALQALMKKFLFNLQELLPVPNFEQTSLWLSLSPSILKECVDFMNQPKPLRTLIQHHKHHGHKVPPAASSSGDDCILSSLSYQLPNVDIDKGDAVVKTEPTFDPQDWQADNQLSSESKQDEVFYSEFVKNEEEHDERCANDLTEDQGASVEVILPSFDENESSDDDQMDKKCLQYLKSGRLTSAKKFKCHVCGKDFSSRSKLKKHEITHRARVTTRMSQSDSASQRTLFNNVNLHLKLRTCENDASRFETELPSFAREITHNPSNQNYLSNSELSNEDGSLACHVCTKEFASQENFDKHKRMCAGRSKGQEEMDPHCSSSSTFHTEPHPVDKTNKSVPFESSNEESKDLTSSDSLQDQPCKRSSRVKQCSICREIFTSSTDLMKHMRSHTEQSPYLGSNSGEYFDNYEDCKKPQENKCKASNQSSKDSSMSHENKVKQEIDEVSSEISQIPKKRRNACKPILTCPQCGQRFTYCKRFEEHLKKCSEAASQTKEPTNTNYFIINGCDFFSVDNTTESNAEKSSETMESQTATSSTADDADGSQCKDGTFKCTMCEKDFSNIVLMQRHYSESHGVRGPYPCTLCKTTFTRLCELVRHQQNKQLFQCPICKKGFRTPEEIKRHTNVHKPRVTTTSFNCETCGRSFKFRVNLIMHQRKHRERPPNVCSYCGKKFSSRDTLKAHLVRHTDGYPCPECGKVFYQKTLLTYHLYKHKGQEPYLCDTCGKGWPNAALLKVHMVKHREDRPFKCDECGVTYKWESSLISHHRSKHIGLRPFVCEVCSKAFRINSELKKHMMVHTGERPYSCPMCGKKFTKGYNLKKHREKPCL
ncbi:zinc finger protein 99-like isoform X1 [Labrus mixtus]|uniref:zinc finger protein 99-like isoform X1 n=1 Tax=Labrus mixtus TaxID=508554 RepID=UPI0029C08635|nr:zinc finger protein 99-like isoform X1 [Labrus mixtus]